MDGVIAMSKAQTKGYKLDLWFDEYSQACAFGRRDSRAGHADGDKRRAQSCAAQRAERRARRVG